MMSALSLAQFNPPSAVPPVTYCVGGGAPRVGVFTVGGGVLMVGALTVGAGALAVGAFADWAEPEAGKINPATPHDTASAHVPHDRLRIPHPPRRAKLRIAPSEVSTHGWLTTAHCVSSEMQALDGNGENPVDLRMAMEANMRRLVWFVLAALAGVAGGCADNTYSPFSFKEFPGYTPTGSKAPAGPHHTPAGYAP